MDRSFLSRADVVKASRAFVCARLATYESAAEAEFLRSIFTGRSGELENTVFAVLAPDGKTKLTRAGRSPEQVFGEALPGARHAERSESIDEKAARMVATLDELARSHPGVKSEIAKPGALPYAADVRRAVNIAACDLLPVAIVVVKDADARTKAEEALRALASDDAFIGRFVWVSASVADDLKDIEGTKSGAVLVVAQPDAFGLTAKVLTQTSSLDPKALRGALADALLAQKAVVKDAGAHIREGRKLGVDWESEIPVTDPGPGQGRGAGGDRRPPR